MAEPLAGFTQRQAQRIADGVRRAEGIAFDNAPEGAVAGVTGRRPRRAKITAVTAVSGRRRYTLQCGFWDGASGATTGGAWTVITMPGTCYGFAHIDDCLPVGAYVFIEFDYLDAGNLYFSIMGRNAGVLFPVTLTQTGGSTGSGTAACSFTYTVKDLDGNTLATTASPAWGRPNLGKMSAGTVGTAYYTAAGAVVLFQANEHPVKVKRAC